MSYRDPDDYPDADELHDMAADKADNDRKRLLIERDEDERFETAADEKFLASFSATPRPGFFARIKLAIRGARE